MFDSLSLFFLCVQLGFFDLVQNKTRQIFHVFLQGAKVGGGLHIETPAPFSFCKHAPEGKETH